MRKLFFALLLLLGVLFLIGRAAELENIAATLRRARPGFLLLALAVQVLWYLNTGLNFRIIYRALGIEESLGRLSLLALAANFVNVVAPSMGMGGLAVFLAEARRQRYSAARSAVASALYILSEYLGFLGVLTLGLVVLIRRNNLHAGELTASAIMALLALGLMVLLYLGMHSAEQLGNVLAFLARLVNTLLRPLLRRPYISEHRARFFAQEAAEGLQTLRHSPQTLAWIAFLGLTSKGLLILVLLLAFLAYDVPFSPGTIIAGFSLGYLFFIVSPTPSGIGVVEGLLTVALRSLYVPLDKAAVITLTYRAVTFWIPLLFGPLAFRLVEHFDSPHLNNRRHA